MFGIRKFVVGAGTAGLLAAAALLAFAPTGVAATRSFDEAPTTSLPAVSAACTAAIQTIKDAVVADRAEDAAERAVAKTQGFDAVADQAEDAAERANFIALFKAARTACAPTATTPAVHTFTTPSPACTAAIQALKAAWAQGRPTTRAEWMQLATLGQAVRAACWHH
jgi:hypothetical protein